MIMEWWITLAGITRGPASLAGSPLYAGPYQTKAGAQAAWAAGVRPGTGTANGTGTGAVSWWVVIQSGSDKAAVIGASSKPAGYATVLGPFPSRTAAEKIAGIKPTTIQKAAVGGSGGVSVLAAVGGLLGKLGQPLFWLRAAEVVIGAVLLIVGIGKMTGAGSTVMQVMKNAPKVIPV